MGKGENGRAHNGSYTAYGAGRKSDSGADYRAATAALVARVTHKNPAKLVREVLGDRDDEKPGDGGRFADLPRRGSLVDERPPKRG